MRARFLPLLFGVLSATLATAQARRTTLDIYVVDVEGGNAVLFVAPSGETVLIDSPCRTNRPAPSSTTETIQDLRASGCDLETSKRKDLLTASPGKIGGRNPESVGFAPEPFSLRLWQVKGYFHDTPPRFVSSTSSRFASSTIATAS